MNEVQKYSFIGGSCLVIGLILGLGASNSNNAKSTNDIAEVASQTDSHALEIIDLGMMQAAC